jgi:hypothetical protein
MKPAWQSVGKNVMPSAVPTASSHPRSWPASNLSRHIAVTASLLSSSTTHCVLRLAGSTTRRHEAHCPGCPGGAPNCSCAAAMSSSNSGPRAAAAAAAAADSAPSPSAAAAASAAAWGRAGGRGWGAGV